MKSRQVILELQPNRLDVVVFEGGRHRRSVRIMAELDSDPQVWTEGVAGLESALRNAVRSLGVEGYSTIVLYASPTQVVELAGTEVKSASDACDAARLRCIDSLPFSALTAVCDARYAGRDAGRGAGKTHAVAAADREDVLSAIADLVEQSGLRFEYATPISASIFRVLASQSFNRKDPCVGRLYLGERHSYFVISDRGRIVFSRLINIGIDALARSLTRPIRTELHDGDVELHVEEARRILYESGIPDEIKIVDELRGLTSKHIMPLLQPVLQRLLVELRQSMRFGLTEKQRADIRLHVSGPGCAVSGIPEYLSEELGLPVEADLSYRGYDAGEPAAAGSEFLDSVRIMDGQPPVTLQPESYANFCRRGKLRQWMWAGAAAAVLLIALDGIGYQIRLDAMRRNMQLIEGLSEQYDLMEQNGGMLRAALVALNELDRNVMREMGAEADYRAALHELGGLVPDDVRFTKIQFRRAEEDTVVALSGYAFANDKTSGEGRLEQFMDALQRSPLLRDMRLVTVQTAMHEKRLGKRFEVSGVLVHTPNNLKSARVAIADGDDSP